MVVERTKADMAKIDLVALQEKVKDRFGKMDAMVRRHRAGRIEEHIHFLLAAVEGESFFRVVDREDNARTGDGHPKLAQSKPL